MLQMAQCHEKLGEREARKIYEQIVKGYGDQAGVAAQARAKLGSRANDGVRVRGLEPAALRCMPQVLGRDTNCHRSDGIFVRDLQSGRSAWSFRSRARRDFYSQADFRRTRNAGVFRHGTGMRAVGRDGSGDRALRTGFGGSAIPCCTGSGHGTAGAC
jgi:hypothetical protein